MYRKSLELDPESPTAHYNLAASLARSGEFAEAETHFRAVIEKNPTTQAYTGLGVVLRQQGRTEEANKELERAKALEQSQGVAQ
jgi:Flp pilus assembly protein TadD